MNLGRIHLFLFICCAISSGCALPPTTSQPEADAPAIDVQVAAIQPKPPARAFSRDTLYSLLTAEIAGTRQQYDVALNNYTQQAKVTRDPQVAERATMIARYLNETQAASDNALLWVELAPDSDEALANAAFALMQAGRAMEAFEMSRRLQSKGKETLFQSIAANANTLPATQRETLKGAFLAQLQLTPKDEQLLVGTGILYHLLEQHQEALGYAQQALKLNADSVPATLLETNMLHVLKRTPEALEKMAALLERQPDSQRLRLQYARVLAHSDVGLAQKQFERLLEQSPSDSDILLSLALVATENKDHETAVKAFEQLLDNNQHMSTAHYYLGQIAETRADPDQAVLHYLQVTPGNEFLQSTINLFDILIQQGDLLSANDHVKRLSAAHPELADNLQLLYNQTLMRHNLLDDAEQSLSAALVTSPTNIELLYARAILRDQRGQLPAAEQDLRAILALDPNNATALNTLGYLLVDRTQRFEEAGELLRRAISLKPEDPAIIDSLGWLYFHTGNYPEALIYLRRAFAAYPDAEIAAHLGEVLWTIDEREEALDIWHEALKKAPTSDIIQRTMERLQAAPQ